MTYALVHFVATRADAAALIEYVARYLNTQVIEVGYRLDSLTKPLGAFYPKPVDTEGRCDGRLDVAVDSVF